MALIPEQLTFLDKRAKIPHLHRRTNEDIPTRYILQTPINLLNLPKFELHNKKQNHSMEN